ncbi:bacterio-opsin activator domain-containing protein [Halorussus amylolyticus]|uniref:bacterio-opsin activator domain-containing protein n=1 Tax=Halorussus amylolyticus TaxID=1126242 RepID=UPI00104D267D|nr:bacterio-opsin activator domain-containing protein [Halorussus amylolyticus]
MKTDDSQAAFGVESDAEGGSNADSDTGPSPDSGLDTEALRRQVQQLTAIIESSTDAIMVKDREGRYQFVNEATAEYLGRDKEAVVGETDEELFGEETGAEIRRRERAVRETERTHTCEETLEVADGERVFESTRTPYYAPDGDLAGTVTVCRDVTDRKVRERTLESQRDELATVNRINEVAREVIRELIAEPNREEIEQAVCDRLVGSELYQVAWVGHPDSSATEQRYAIGSELSGDLRKTISIADPSSESDEPVPRAYHTGETVVVPNAAADDSLPEERRTALLDSGLRSGIAVPIQYGNATYGVLAVGSDRCSAFSERETDAFELLGEVIGFAINAVKHRQLALSDTITELEFRLADSNSFYIAASEELGCPSRLEGVAVGPDGSLLRYDSVSDADAQSVLDFAAEWDAVEDVRVVSEHCDRALIEFALSGSSVVLTLSEYGANTVEAVASNGEGRIVAELPTDADVREVVEHVQSVFPGVELAAKHEREREVQTAHEFRQELTDRLTDAQRTALRASYFSGYYEWPRDSTAEEIAESLDIASPTLHEHLRAAQRELLTTFFDRDRNRP